MNIKRRLTLRFALHSAIAGLIILVIAAITVLWVLQRFADISMSNNFASVGLERLVESSEFGVDGISFDPQLLEQVKKNNGWLQSLDEMGGLESSFNTPPDLPKQYAPGELIAYWRGEREFPYELYLWIQEKNGRLYTLLYGIPKVIEPLMRTVSEANPTVSDGKLVLPQEVANRISGLRGYVQLLDSGGMQMASFNRPTSVPEQYSIQELALRAQYDERYGFKIATFYDEEEDVTWVVGLPFNGGVYSGKESFIPEEARVVFIGIAGMLAATLVIFALLSLLNAHRFGTPILHMQVWLDSLGKATFEEPKDRKGHPRSRKGSGKWRGKYRVFANVMFAMDKLSGILKRDQDLRQHTDTLREEWITGITHDLKTPLSSIKGYAHLMVEDTYEWSMVEVRKFSAIMLEKSEHMDTLISDLAITYRMKTGIHPPMMEEVEMNVWLGNTLVQAAANPVYGEGRIKYNTAQRDVMAHLYTPWLERIVYNLTANALLHNSPDTQLTVTLSEKEGEGMVILFTDNGKGMDEITTANLFERYYRGVDTASTTFGSGLGMAVSKGLVEAMGGLITAESTPGKGTTIRLSWVRM
ncbi:signal transduction histidine kinase [Paenibacillus sp. DS2015]|uniref:sensor histidine kinase n=1 Tax=Paenibacillus sp. DS2015 TaxID=3373917 RepID=UPI003D23A972